VIRLLCRSIVLTAHVRRVRVSECQPRSWAVTLIKNRGVLLGYVEAPDPKAAELVAAMLNEWQRKRLLVGERIEVERNRSSGAL
jgi:hypothetical protein